MMALQIAGSRVLAPHFGSSLFIWAGLIGVFLLALSIGYFLGGWAGDRWPILFTLNMAVGGAGLLCLLIPHIAIPVCVSLVKWGPRWGPLVSATVLFTAPSIFLGSVSPIAFRLFAKGVTTSGRDAGSLYALSTLGSLAGTFLATFVLVPSMGTPGLIMALGSVLALLPFVGMAPSIQTAFYGVPAAALALAFFTSPLPSVPLAPSGDREYGATVHEAETPYHRIFVVEGRDEGKDVRYLQFDHYLESGVQVEAPYHSVTRYTDMFHLFRLFNDAPESAVFIGGGGMVGPRLFESTYPEFDRIDVVEIDPEVVAVSKRFFAFDPGPKVHVHTTDGRIFLSRTDLAFDVVVLDAYTGGGRIPFHLLTREFFEIVEQRTRAGSVVLLNLIGGVVGPKSKVFRAVYKTMDDVFPGVQVFPRSYHWQSNEVATKIRKDILTYMRNPDELDEESRKNAEHVRNIFLVAVRRDHPAPTDEALLNKARQLEKDGLVPERFALTRQVLTRIEDVPTSDLPMLTDDFAPVEQWKTW